MSRAPQTLPTNDRAAVFTAMSAYVIWGFFPIYFKILQSVPAMEMLAQRIVWAVPFGALIIAYRKQWPAVHKAITTPRTLLFLMLSTTFVAINWGVYIWAVQSGQIMQASLGYYINPLIFVFVGMFFFGETLRVLQIIAVILAAIGVAILTVRGGQFPWIAIILATSWTIYAIVRKQLDVGAMPGLFIETAIAVPIAAIYLIWLSTNGTMSLTPDEPVIAFWIFMAGPLTVLPLLAFAVATKRLTLSLLGFLQFIGPTLQFGCALYYGEPLTTARLICFIFIWTAVAFFCVSAWQNGRQRNLPKPV
ncbi:EamA family transporter RarD [Robiginitomaculum antarcticum]|uniref:EamA family transporter RarD n=1 Tax=Robiginitomaculum antarcticum TaxID=437507 RepID=UPI00036D5577|nr:EamA family transporter RarD [Robiginitomaculum antarcticum]